MSASNWARCPRCTEEARRSEVDQLADLMQSYGKIPLAEFDERRAAIKPLDPDSEKTWTFREDYEIFGAETGLIQVSYSGHCGKCRLGIDFTVERRIWGTGT